MAEIGILGAGTWGVALARLLAGKNMAVTVYSRSAERARILTETRRHAHLADVVLPDSIVFTSDLAHACHEKDIVLFAVPSVNVRDMAHAAAPYLADGQVVVDAAKGIEPDTLMTMTEVIEDEVGKACGDKHLRLVALSGPTHAEEVVKDMPTMIVSACKDVATAKYVQDIFMDTCMRVYTNSDVAGVELCGAMKNIMALAAGMAVGMGCGDNTKAALITRGVVEIARLGRAMGCSEETFYGLTGMGDLIVTATSRHSRNNQAGYLIGKGLSVTEAIERVGMVVEGIYALPAAKALCRKYHVEMPIVDGVYEVVHCGADPQKVMQQLMCRAKKAEKIT